MLTSHARRLAAVAAPVTALLILTGSARAVPVTVHLRVEGSAATLYDGNITTDSRVIEAPDAPKAKGEALGPPHPHACDVKDNGEFPAGEFGTAYGNPTTALYDMARSLGLAFNAIWYASFNDFFVNGVGSLGPEGSESWGYAVNNTTAAVGGCQFQVAPGSEVLWASNFGLAKHLLRLSGPVVANAGTGFSVHVADGQNGEPISGASIGEVLAGVTTPIPASPTTDSSGNATVSIAHAGTVTLKAIRAEAVRSNAISVCVHAGADGSCGTSMPLPSGAAPKPSTSTPAAVAEVLGVKNGHVYRRRFAPRVLGGMAELSSGATLRELRMRLERRFHGRCFAFSGLRARFVHVRKCGSASFFRVGVTQSFSYFLPAPLALGRYVYDVESVDANGQVSKLLNGVSHVVFRVS